MLQTTYRSILVSEISKDSRWNIHQDVELKLDTVFSESLVQCGILHPPIVQETKANRYELVCGQKRLFASINLLKTNKIFCQLLPQELQASQILLLVLEDQKLSGQLSPIEKGRFYRKWEQHVIKGKKQYAREPEPHGLRGFKKFTALLKLEKPIIAMLHEGLMAEQTGFSLLSLDQEERSFLCDIFQRLCINKNKQKRILELAQIGAAQKGCTLQFLLQPLLNNYSDRNIPENLPQTVNKLLQDLYKISHPAVHRAESRFKQLVQDLQLPAQCSLQHSPAFEKDSLTFSVDYPNEHDFLSHWPSLQKLLS